MSTIKASLVVKEDSINTISNTLEFTLKEKSENLVVLNNSSYTLDLSEISNIVFLAFEGSGDFNVAFTQAGATVTFEASDYWANTITPASISTMTSIVVSETNSTDISVKIVA